MNSTANIAGMTLPIARDLASNGIFGTPMMFGMPQEVQDSLAASVPSRRAWTRPSITTSWLRHVVENEMLNGVVIRLDGASRLAPK